MYDNSKAFASGLKIAEAIKNKFLMESLERICYNAVAFAEEKHNFDNQSYNLENSYAFGIFHLGALMKVETIGSGVGADEAKSFISSYIPKRNWECVVVAGAKYAAALEGYIRRTDGERSKAGEEIKVLSDSFNFVTLESIRLFKKGKK